MQEVRRQCLYTVTHDHSGCAKPSEVLILKCNFHINVNRRLEKHDVSPCIYILNPISHSSFRFNSIRAMSLDATMMVMSDVKPLLSNEYRSLADGSGIICADDYDLNDFEQLMLIHDRLGVSHPWILTHGNQATVPYGLQVSLNKQIFFFDVDSSTLKEVYSVDEFKIERRIGFFDENFKVSCTHICRTLLDKMIGNHLKSTCYLKPFSTASFCSFILKRRDPLFRDDQRTWEAKNSGYWSTARGLTWQLVSETILKVLLLLEIFYNLS